MDWIVAYCTIEGQEVPYNRLILFGLEPVNIIVWTSIPYNGPVVMSVIIFRVRAIFRLKVRIRLKLAKLLWFDRR